MILLDTSGLYAALVQSQRGHRRTRAALEAEAGPLILSPYVIAEVDYFLLHWEGVEHEAAFLHEAASGAFELAVFGTEEVSDALAVVEAYRDLKIGLADASLVVLAERYGTDRILTLDERHFRVLQTPSGKPFRLLPADA